MKTSNVLNIETSLFIKDEIVINPNEGYDLGLLNQTTPVKIFANTSIDIFNTAKEFYTEGTVVLKNSCKQGNIQVSKKYWVFLGKPGKIRLFYNENKILISNM